MQLRFYVTEMMLRVFFFCVCCYTEYDGGYLCVTAQFGVILVKTYSI